MVILSKKYSRFFYNVIPFFKLYSILKGKAGRIFPKYTIKNTRKHTFEREESYHV